jgi:hypothetical protein
MVVCYLLWKEKNTLPDYDFSMIVAAKLYEDTKLSARQAEEIIG